MAKSHAAPALKQALHMAEAGADAFQSSAAQKDASGPLGNDTRPTIASLSDAGAKLFAQAYQLNRASELAYASGHKASGAAYREAAKNASAASDIYFRSAAKMSDDAERIAQAARPNPFGPGWNHMGQNSAGFSKDPSGTAAVGVNVSTGTGVADQLGIAMNAGANGSKVSVFPATSVPPELSAA